MSRVAINAADAFAMLEAEREGLPDPSTAPYLSHEEKERLLHPITAQEKNRSEFFRKLRTMLSEEA